jgi:three-Cys-motif partner protein
MTPHTKAKHVVLDKYLKGWFPILSSIRGRIIYLDGFAGSGQYDDSSVGSPIIALEIAKNHLLKLPSEIVFIFIEKDDRRAGHLERLLDEKYSRVSSEKGKYRHLPENFKVYTNHGEFNSVMDSVLTVLEKQGERLAPTFAFVDPFGYLDINTNILGRILKFPKCELLITYMVGFLDRFAFDDSHRKSIRALFSLENSDIDRIISISDKESREKEWLRLLTDNLTKSSDTTPYHLDFRVVNRLNQTMYYLVYFTKSIDGIRVMKEAMWKVGREGEYLFSDFNFVPGQISILDYIGEIWIDQAADKVKERFSGQTIDLSEIEGYVLVETPFKWRKGILKNLEDRNLITVTEPRIRRKGTFPDGSRIKFY